MLGDFATPEPMLLPMISDARNVVRYVWTHPANESRRIRALLRAARFQLTGRLWGRPTLATLGDNSRIWAYLHRTAASKVVYANPPDYPEMVVWREVLHPGDLFIDVGANIGSYAILAAESGAEVIALEPAPDTYALLLENIALNGYPVRAILAAAGAQAGVARFTSGQDSVNRFDSQGSASTNVVTIDSLIGDRVVTGMKVDVEGFEIEVLQGCERALSEHRIRLLQLEWNTGSLAAVGSDRSPVANHLAKYGYSLYRPDSRGVLVPVSDASFGPDVFAFAGTLPASLQCSAPPVHNRVPSGGPSSARS